LSSRSQVEAVRDGFVAEAKVAPRLFSDLAQMEQYIAESYKTRSFIELIQNADDARATKFGIHQMGPDIVVGNNGHPFTHADVEALCRSGSSHKVRGQNTIGYRGIGFKSVVNISQRIAVLSGDYVFCFDRAETKRLLPSLGNVPLIRVPIVPSEREVDSLRHRVSELKKLCEYETIFVFSSGDPRLVEDELSSIDRHAFLFLRSVKEVEFDLLGTKRTVSVNRAAYEEREITSIREGDVDDSWLLLRNPEVPNDAVAFRFQDGAIVPADSRVAVLHSFLPTAESSGALLKINGDYSTDPSRKAIDLDETSRTSFENAASLIANAVTLCIERKQVLRGLLRPLTEESPAGRFKRLLHELLAAHFEKTQVLVNGKKQFLKSLRLRPEWLGYDDYESICRQSGCQISKTLISEMPELPAFCARLEISRLSIAEALDRVNSSVLSLIGAAQIFVKFALQYRYELTPERVEKLRHLKIFPIKGQFVQASAVSAFEQMDVEFVRYVVDNVESSDLSPLLAKLGVPYRPQVPAPATAAISQGPFGGYPGSSIRNSAAIPNLVRWRSAEKNAEEYFRSLPDVLTVSDVAVANMGYDLEVVLSDGAKVYVEVKSVKSFAEPIKITNNEYASAHKYGTAYVLAIVINGDEFALQVIADPVRTLVFQKQIERWSWICESYTAQLREMPQRSLLLGGK
jgi:hypothetical protein